MTDAQIWAALPSPSMVVDAQDRVLRVNAAGEQALNASARQICGTPLWRWLDPGHEPGPWQRMWATQGALTLMEARLRPNGLPEIGTRVEVAVMGGEAVVVLLPAAPLHGRGRAPSGHAVIGLAQMLAHEIKNPLAGISGAAQLLSMDLAEDNQQLTDLILEESRRIVSLLDQVEQFGDQSPAHRRAVNLHDVLDRAKQSAQLGFAAHMTLREDYDPSLPPAHVDADQLLQILLNLLKNAAQASPDGAQITLRSFYDARLRRRDDHGTELSLPLHLQIIDTGPGLPRELGEAVFEPFVSGRENGTGLGLALVSKLMRQNGGWVSVDSAPGDTRFTLSFQRHRNIPSEEP